MAMGWMSRYSIQKKAKMNNKAKKQLNKVSEIIVKEGVTYEILDKNGVPVKNIFYTSEHPFSWTAGAFIYTLNEMKISVE